MLILSRRNGETVIVGGGGGLDRMIKITVLKAASGGVKLGFDVERDIPVHREEVWQRMCASGDLQEGIDYVKPT
jgi:carbon storage regulator CsrA